MDNIRLLFEGLGISSNNLRANTVSGGDINDCYKVETSDGVFFLKTNSDVSEDFFQQEANNLRYQSELLKLEGTPQVIAVGPIQNFSTPFLLLEYIEPAIFTTKRDYDQLINLLIKLHGNSHSNFGWKFNNYIGLTSQKNNWTEDGIEFYEECRFYFQFELAFKQGKINKSEYEHCLRFLPYIKKVLDPLKKQKSSFCHGDLWSGNIFWSSQGKPYLIDGASYYGYSESDMAMTMLFGMLPKKVYTEYYRMNPAPPGLEERIELFNLYHLFNHLNLFGYSYWSSCKRVISRYCS